MFRPQFIWHSAQENDGMCFETLDRKSWHFLLSVSVNHASQLCHNGMGQWAKPSLVAPVGSCMGSCFMSCVYWRGRKGRGRERFIYLLPRFLLWGLHGRNCRTASGINNSIKDVAVGTMMEGKWAPYLVWLTMKDFYSKASAVIEDLVGQAVEHFQDTSDVCCHCHASLCFLSPILLSWIEYNLQVRSVISVWIIWAYISGEKR